MRRLALALALVGALWGCGSDDAPQNPPPPGTTCEGDACDPGACEAHEDCASNAYCDEATGRCQPRACTPGTTRCEGDAVVTCDAAGAGYGAPSACPGECRSGACGCASDRDCGADERCDQIEVCDGEACQTVAQCRPRCEGTVCGLQGELCCAGDTPACSPAGACAVACEPGAELCGEGFDQCCDVGDVCVFGACRTPGAACAAFTDCGWGEYCDPGLGRCMSDAFPEEIACRLEGDFRDFDVRLKWSWEEADLISIPVVGDVTGDGRPNVVVNATIANDWMTGQVVILDADGQEVRRIAHDPEGGSWGSQGRSNIALGDVDGDGVMDIIYAGRPVSGSSGHIVAVKGDGTLLWRAHDASGAPVLANVSNGAVTVANFDEDPSRVEVVVGGMLIDSDGLVRWDHNSNGPALGSNSGYRGGVAVVVDLTGDGQHEILTGRDAWRVDWQPGATPGAPSEVTVSPLWSHDGPDGYTAIADFDGDGRPEVVLVASQTVRVLEGATGLLWCGVDPTGQACQDDPSARTQPVLLPGPANNNRGGPPTVADFDGDGRPEIGVAGGHFYAVFDANRPGFGVTSAPEAIDATLLERFEVPAPALGQLFVRWKRASRDLSSNATGSAVFDFQGDGVASVIYGDECFMRSFSGLDGEVELEIMNSTGTILEYPLVVDVDANSRSEILIVANDVNACSGLVDNYVTRRGLFVYEDPNDRWVRTRSIWNQHAYSNDNILDSGAVPATQAASWATHNTFRANRQGEIPLNAPDVVVASALVNARTCPTHLYFQATIQNKGTSGVPAGLPVSLYQVDPSALIETIALPAPLAPGGTTIVRFDYEVPYELYNRDLSFTILANDPLGGEPFVADCHPETATKTLEGVRCALPL